MMMDVSRHCFSRFVFEKTFPTCLTLDHLQGALTADNVYMELLQVRLSDQSGAIYASLTNQRPGYASH